MKIIKRKINFLKENKSKRTRKYFSFAFIICQVETDEDETDYIIKMEMF